MLLLANGEWPWVITAYFITCDVMYHTTSTVRTDKDAYKTVVASRPLPASEIILAKQ